MFGAPHDTDAHGSAMEDLDQGILPDLLGRQIRLTYLAAFRLVENRLAAFGITPQQFSLLAIVERNPGSRQSLLARARGLDKSTLVPMIDRLERDGMVERRPLATDRRIRTIWITERGKDILAEAIPAVQDGDRAIGLNLSEAEHQEFRRLLEKVRLGLAEQ